MVKVALSSCTSHPPSHPESVYATVPESIAAASKSTERRWARLELPFSGPPEKKFTPRSGGPGAVASISADPYLQMETLPVIVQPGTLVATEQSELPAPCSAPGF